MRNSAHEEIIADKHRRMLQFRADAEAACDAQEEQANPSDRTGFHLRKLETVTSHLVEVAMGIGTVRPRVTFAGYNIFAYADVAIERAGEGNTLHQQDEQWRRLWDSLKTGIFDLQRWAGDADTAAKLAKVIFVTVVVLRRVYEAGSEGEPSGEERGFEFCASEVPFPIEIALPLAEQVQCVSRNLEWFRERMRSDIVWPRWW